MNAMDGEEKYIDLGYGAIARLSSSYFDSNQDLALVPARHKGGRAFHTKLEQSPNVVIDLGTARKIRRLRIFNSDELPGRAIPTEISISLDGEAWHLLSHTDFVFGGRGTGTPLDLFFREPRLCQFVKVVAASNTFLHLDYVEILGAIPACEFGRFTNVRVDQSGIFATYQHGDSHGFFWTFTCTLGSIFSAMHFGLTVDGIDYSPCLRQFKTIPTDNLYPILFTFDRGDLRGLPAVIPQFERHGVYSTFPLNVLKKFVDIYFQPSLLVRQFEQYIIDRYQLDLDRVIAIVYRGTDKSIEVGLASIAAYVDVARWISVKHPGMRIVIQSDQRQAIEAVKSAFPDSVYFDELPSTSGNVVVHDLPLEREFGLERPQFAIRILAVTHLLSKAAIVITHTGNLSAWIALYRGAPDGLYQFDSHGELRDPEGSLVDITDMKAAP